MRGKTELQGAPAPGWPEIAVAFAIYLTGVAVLGYWMMQRPGEETIFRINIAGGINGALGLTALIAAYAMRVRNWQAFGFRAVKTKWLLAGAALGVVAFGLSFFVESVYFSFVSEPNTQADFQAAAKGGPAQLALILFTGAILGPVGEELVFRGVIASALLKYGKWSGVTGSAFLFALIHGPSVIFFDALLVGLLTGLLFGWSRSIWPAVLLHIVYNALHISFYSIM